MKFTDVTFAAFNRFLRKLGFTREIVVSTEVLCGKYVRYEHPESDAVVLARLHKPEDLVPWHTFVSTRLTLVDRGLTTEEAFERLERRSTVARQRKERASKPKRTHSAKRAGQTT